MRLRSYNYPLTAFTQILLRAFEFIRFYYKHQFVINFLVSIINFIVLFLLLNADWDIVVKVLRLQDAI